MDYKGISIEASLLVYLPIKYAHVCLLLTFPVRVITQQSFQMWRGAHGSRFGTLRFRATAPEELPHLSLDSFCEYSAGGHVRNTFLRVGSIPIGRGTQTASAAYPPSECPKTVHFVDGAGSTTRAQHAGDQPLGVIGERSVSGGLLGTERSAVKCSEGRLGIPQWNWEGAGTRADHHPRGIVRPLPRQVLAQRSPLCGAGIEPEADRLLRERQFFSRDGRCWRRYKTHPTVSARRSSASNSITGR